MTERPERKAAGIVLAAGRGTRFGGGKMLAKIGGQPMLQHVLDLAAQAELTPIVVVLGDDAEAVEAAIAWSDEVRIRNEDPARGISSSVSLGLRAVAAASANVGRVVVMLGDQPALGLDQLNALLSAEPDSDRPIVVPRYADGQPGNPVRLEREAWALTAWLMGDRGMSRLFVSRPDLVRYVDVAGSNPGVDTPADLATLSRAGGPGRSDRTAGEGRRRP